MSTPYRAWNLGAGSWTQCELQSPSPTGVTIQVAWIQTKHAVISNVVTIPRSNRQWTVAAVYQTKAEAKQ